MKRNKPRWKDLPLNERLSKRCKQKGVSDEMCEHIRQLGAENDRGTEESGDRES